MNLQFGISASLNKDTSVETNSKMLKDPLDIPLDPILVQYSPLHPVSQTLNTSVDYGRSMRDSINSKKADMKYSMVSQSLDA